MAKVTGPLLSFGGAGQIGKTQVYASWKGRQYARRYVVPANPSSDGQKLTRAVFTYLFGLYRYADASAIASMGAAASAARLTTANMFPRANLKLMRANVNNHNLVLSPGAGGAPATPAAVLTPGANNLSGAIPDPVLPTGWMATPHMYAAAVAAWNGTGFADVGTDFTMFVADDATSPYVCNITGLAATTDYVYVNWYSVARPDGTLAYGVSNVQVGTTT